MQDAGVLELNAPGTRLDSALLEALRKRGSVISRARLKQLFQEGRVFLDGRRAKASEVLGERAYQAVIDGAAAAEAEAFVPAAAPEGSFIPVVYEDEDILVLHKPSGIPSSPLTATETRTAVSSALAQFPELARLSSVSRKPIEPGLLHRLDTGTSGLLCFAKTAAELERLRALWSPRHRPEGAEGVRKTYRAIVSAAAGANPATVLPKLPARIELSLAHDQHAGKRMIALNPEHEERGGPRRYRGSPLSALTHLLEATALPGATEGSLRFDLTVQIETGVMHQIRCHLSSLGWPVVGDPVYRGMNSSRLWLHAWRLELPLRCKAWLRLEASLPKGWG